MTPLLTFGQMLSVHARLRPDAPGARDLSRAMTFAAWNRRACRFANAILGLGLAKGDRVAVLAYNRVEWLEIYAGAAKAGVVAFTKSLAIEFGNYNIRVNAISPGAIQTEILSLEGMVPPDKMEEVLAASMETMLDFQVLKRIGLPRDIAEAALFLASNRSAQITGLDLIVDAGASLGDKVNRQAKMHADMAAILGSN